MFSVAHEQMHDAIFVHAVFKFLCTGYASLACIIKSSSSTLFIVQWSFETGINAFYEFTAY